ncbi:MAG TPA: metalloregulator ArsR/SmtB family transcription factor [Steroidobacteraceae bacterium]|nr:metalloregulator ArsR/SmtB family transcription factor [Steroidobacteraceae bacterium]
MASKKTLEEAADRAAALLRALAHPGRLRIVCALRDAELPAGQLARLAGLTPPALSQQAAILAAEGLLARRREARSVHYRLVGEESRAVAGLLEEIYCGGGRGLRRSPTTKREAR